MSSRQEEKERRRLERQAREQAEASKAANKRRLQLVAGGVLALAAIAAVIAAVVSGGGGGGSSKASADYVNASLPAKKISDFDAAVKAAGCTFKTYPSEGRTHLPSDSAVNNKYKTNPPTSGDHRPTPAQDGVYAPGNSPDKENAVHALEHGRIELEYKKGASKQVQGQVNALFNEKLKGVEGYHKLMFENNTNMPFEVAAVAWTQLLGCPTMNAQVPDAIRAFEDRFVNKGPEIIP
ncbi:MAG: hypothetical protein JWP53_2240 [Conexibacter sp.]|nr:hypothetical protein [Conexibacter sp.]